MIVSSRNEIASHSTALDPIRSDLFDTHPSLPLPIPHQSPNIPVVVPITGLVDWFRHWSCHSIVAVYIVRPVQSVASAASSRECQRPNDCANRDWMRHSNSAVPTVSPFDVPVLWKRYSVETTHSFGRPQSIPPGWDLNNRRHSYRCTICAGVFRASMMMMMATTWIQLPHCDDLQQLRYSSQSYDESIWYIVLIYTQSMLVHYWRYTYHGYPPRLEFLQMVYQYAMLHLPPVVSVPTKQRVIFPKLPSHYDIVVHLYSQPMY